MKLNADIGEHEPPARTRALMRLIDLANIACGGHAGDAATMERAVRLAIEFRVSIGAHPGLPADFGRGVAEIGGKELEALVSEQVSALADISRRRGAALYHLKLHGALYHAAERSESLAEHYVDLVRSRFAGLKIVALAGGRVISRCRELGVPAIPEAFAERGYREDGTLIPRGQPGDLVTDPRIAAERVRTLSEDGCIAVESGRIVPIDAQTICVHSDTPNAVRIARAAREALGSRV